MAISPLTRVKVVRAKRLYEQIAEQIQDIIRAEQLQPGTRLPPERDLAEMLGVSRPSVREALIALETAGYIEVRTGDGTFVRRPSGPIFTMEGADYGPGPVEQFEARRAVEPACAKLAARVASREQIDNLEASLIRMKESAASGINPAEEHRVFHTSLADASGNSILAGAVRELWRLRQAELWSTLRKRVEHPSSWERGFIFRRALIDCLWKRDELGAWTEVDNHFARMERQYFGKDDKS